jgi:hypothetical protein
VRHVVGLLVVAAAVLVITPISAGQPPVPVAQTARACDENSPFILGLRAAHTRCQTARRLAAKYSRHTDVCGTSAQPGGNTTNSCRLSASGISFLCRSRLLYAEVTRVRCTHGEKLVRFRFSY